MTHQHNYFETCDTSTSINENLNYLSKKYRNSLPKNNPNDELLELKDDKIKELELIILSLKDEIEYMKYSLNDKIENLKLDHKKELFLLHKQQKKYIKNQQK